MTNKAWLWYLLNAIMLVAFWAGLVDDAKQGEAIILMVIFIATASIHDAIAKLKGPTK